MKAIPPADAPKITYRGTPPFKTTSIFTDVWLL